MYIAVDQSEEFRARAENNCAICITNLISKINLARKNDLKKQTKKQKKFDVSVKKWHQMTVTSKWTSESDLASKIIPGESFLEGFKKKKFGWQILKDCREMNNMTNYYDLSV